ncbi:hypothetical protein VNO78_27472 [Psophocarpus tetragonolobus]|uniref:Uncharacterized protein n=1 Tax=Psophocarpus tetragonolobus TaxID=3891 RepID=A0AAN9S2T2_PSOTE
MESIRTNPINAVPLLLESLVTVEEQENLKDLKSELIKIKDLFSIVKKNEEELLDTLTVVDDYLCNLNLQKLMEVEEEICKRIRNSSQKLLPAGNNNNEAVQSSEKTFQHLKLDKRD